MRSGGHIHHVTRQHLIMWLLVINVRQSEDGGKNDTMMGQAVTSFTLPPTPHTQTHTNILTCVHLVSLRQGVQVSVQMILYLL